MGLGYSASLIAAILSSSDAEIIKGIRRKIGLPSENYSKIYAIQAQKEIDEERKILNQICESIQFSNSC